MVARFAAAQLYLALAFPAGTFPAALAVHTDTDAASHLAGNVTGATAATAATSHWWSALFGGGGEHSANHTGPPRDKWRAGEPYARAHASRDAILEEIAGNRARARQKLDVQRRWMLGTGGPTEWRALVARFEQACPSALRQTKYQSHDLRQHYNKAEEFHEPSGTATGQDADKGSWPKHANMNDLADDDRVMLWQPEPATGLGNSLQV